MTDPKPEQNSSRLVICAVDIIVLWILSQGLNSDGRDNLHLLQAGQQQSLKTESLQSAASVAAADAECPSMTADLPTACRGCGCMESSSCSQQQSKGS